MIWVPGVQDYVKDISVRLYLVAWNSNWTEGWEAVLSERKLSNFLHHFVLCLFKKMTNSTITWSKADSNRKLKMIDMSTYIVFFFPQNILCQNLWEHIHKKQCLYYLYSNSTAKMVKNATCDRKVFLP